MTNRFDSFTTITEDELEERGGVLRDGEKLVINARVMDSIQQELAMKLHDGFGNEIAPGSPSRSGYIFSDHDDRERQRAYETYEKQLGDAYKAVPHSTPVTWGTANATPVSALGYRRSTQAGADPREASYSAYDRAVSEAWKGNGAR